MKTTNRIAALALATVALAANTGCLGGYLLNYAANYRSCDEVQGLCKELVAATCLRIEECGGNFEECVEDVVENGFQCDIAYDVEGDIDDCLDDVEDSLTCGDINDGDMPRSCDDVIFQVEDGVCN